MGILFKILAITKSIVRILDTFKLAVTAIELKIAEKQQQFANDK